MSTRINKYIADCGVASRRAAEEIIASRRVKVNGKIITDLSTQIAETDKVEVDGRIIRCQSKMVYIMMNKPAGVITSCNDQFDRKTVLDVIGKIDYRIFPVGRLDYATEGLLLLTNDGEFARRVTHPSSQIPKTYVAKLNAFDERQLEVLRGGVKIDDVLCVPKKVTANENFVEIIITEGRNRQVRRMFEAVGARVKKLKRTAIGNLTLGNLKPGEFCYIKKPNL